MKTSADVSDSMLHFYDRLSAKDVDSFDSIISGDPATLVIGTAPGEWVTERHQLRFGFEAEGLAIEPGPRPSGWESGDTGWFVDEPTFVFPGAAGRMRTRLTSVLQREGGTWRIVHMHVSVGVPDDEVVALQRRWGVA